MMFVAGALAAVGAAYGSQLLLMAAFMVYSAAEQEKMERAARARYNAAQKDRLNNLDSAVAPRHLQAAPPLLRRTQGRHAQLMQPPKELLYQYIAALLYEATVLGVAATRWSRCPAAAVSLSAAGYCNQCQLLGSD